MRKKEIKHQYIVWVNYGSEGWTPTGYTTLKEALEHDSYSYEKIITKKVEYAVKDITKKENDV